MGWDLLILPVVVSSWLPLAAAAAGTPTERTAAGRDAVSPTRAPRPVAETAGSRHQPLFDRVRSSRARLRAVLRDGYARSPTFSRLVDALEQADVLIYVEPGQCRRLDLQKLTGCVTDLGTAHGIRQLRVVVDMKLSEAPLIATIGHELQHALELTRTLAGGRVVDISGTGARRVREGVYETEAAERIGRVILEETMRRRR